MIVCFSDKKTGAFYDGRRIAAFSGFAQTASRKLDQLDAATSLGDLARPGNLVYRRSRADARDSGASASTTNGGSASSGPMEVPARPKWKSWTTIEEASHA